MGLLDKKFSLPTTSGTVSDANVNYSLVPNETRVNETFTAVQSKFGGVGDFKSLNVGAPTFSKLGADYSLGNVKPSSPYLGMASSVTTGVTATSATASQIRDQTGDGSRKADDSHKVQLLSLVDDLLVMFDIMPEVTEIRNAEYEALQAAQMPGEFQKFKGTKATSWQVNASFTCRTRDEAEMNLAYINTLRAWTMPYFGDNKGRMAGAPPPVLQLYGYRGLVGRVPVVMTSLNWTWPKDCDWIPTTGSVNSRAPRRRRTSRSLEIGTWTTGDDGGTTPFPTVMNVQFTLVESFSANQFNRFDLESFKAGDMVGAYGTQVVTQSETVAEPQSTPDRAEPKLSLGRS